jgi:hypothetical protein
MPEVVTMPALQPAAPEADDVLLDTWLRQALRQAFGGTLAEPLPADMLAVGAGRPQPCSLRKAIGKAHRPGRTGEARARE